MNRSVPDILAKIADHKRAELAERSFRLGEYEALAEERITNHRPFLSALRSQPPAIIAEVKKASPSKGVLSTDFDPLKIAKSYENGGAAALSVLTDERFFQGSLADLRKVWVHTGIPVLRKDFTLDPFHVWEAAAHGADAILLIAALLDTRQMRDLRELAERLAMSALVEVHDAVELDSAVASGAHIIGVNNRDLRTFEVRLETSLELASRMPAGATLVSESGIQSRADVERLSTAGYHAFLVGEHLMRSGDPAAAIRELRG